MRTLDIIKTAVIDAALTALYIVLVASFTFYGKRIFAQNRPDTVFMPIAMLSLLVFSAALVGTLIFGRSLFWYIDGKKKEAITLLLYTLGAFFIITVAAVCAMIAIH